MKNYTRFEKVKWIDIRENVKKVNSKLADIIDDIDPPNNYTFFRGCYNYGEKIVSRGKFQVPNNRNQLVSIADESVPKDIKSELSYDLETNPVSIILENSTEIFIDLEDRTIPLYGCIPPGKIFSTWYFLNPKFSQSQPFVWSMTSGARSIFMLPKISTESGYRRLRKEFNVIVDKPTRPSEHFFLFKEIVNSDNFKSSWHTDILFFGKKWFYNLNDPALEKFKYYLLEQAWQGSEYWRNQFMWSALYSLIENKLNLKAEQYIKDTAKHIITIATGSLPGFSIAAEDNIAPISEIQKIFLDVYKLEDYAPIIMKPSLLETNKVKPIYYSLDYPSTVVFSPRSKKTSSKISDLYDISRLISKYIPEILYGDWNFSATSVIKDLRDTDFNYYHDDSKSYSNIQDVSLILRNDDEFGKVLSRYPNNSQFPLTSTFFRGAVAIRACSKFKLIC